MPGVLVGEKLDPASSVSSPYSVSMPHPSLSHLSPLQHYIPVLTRSIAPEFCGDEPSSHLSPLPQPAGLLLDVNDLPEMYLEDGNLHEPGLPLQLSPVSATQWGCNSASPTTLSALSALRRFLPSNFEEDKSANVSQMDLYAGDEFRMYEFKVKRCMRGRSHDWTECPFVHLGEKARRRDLRRFHYSGTPCADFRKGSCKKGNQCEFAHGVFECWLHPARYRTQPCKDGRGCRRRVCFFAHTPDQLRVSSPIASPSVLSSPTSRHFAAMEAFDLWGPSSPTSLCSPVKLSEPFPSSFSSSPFCRTGMEALDDATAPSNFSLLAPSSVSRPMSSSPSSPDASINWSPRGVSAYTLPVPHPSLQSNHSQVSLLPGSVPHCRHSESMNLSIPTAQIQSKSASSLPTLSSCTTVVVSSTMQQIDDLVSLLKQANLEQQEPAWLQVGGAPPPQLLNFLVAPLQGRTGSVPVKPTKVGFRASDEELLNGGFFNDDKGGESCEAKLERVESGKGLRAQIFESLLRSASTDQESNSQPSMS